MTELRKQIQVAIEMGELSSLDDAGRYVYENLQIQVVERKSWKYSPETTASIETNSRKKSNSHGNATQTASSSYRFVVKDA